MGILCVPSGSKQDSPTDCKEKKAEGEKSKPQGQSPRFKRKLSCVSSSQPTSTTTTDWFVEYKKQAQIAKKMRLRADRANEKLELVRSQLKIIKDIINVFEKRL